MKVCTSCKKEKALTEFYKDSKMKAGYRSNCKACADKTVKIHRQLNKVKNKETTNRLDIRFKKCGTCYEGKSINSFSRNNSVRDGFDTICKACRAISNKAINYSVNKQEIKDLLALQKSSCKYCKIPLINNKFHIDHVIPKSKGGTDDLSNLVLACKTCNLAKGNLTLEEFYSWLERVSKIYYKDEVLV